MAFGDPRVPMPCTDTLREIGTKGSAEGAVQVEGGADEGQVGERLREVALLLAGAADLLGVQAEVVGVGEHLLEGEPGLVEPAGPDQRLDVPEGADGEGPLVAAQPVG